MLTAHLPSGYILGAILEKDLEKDNDRPAHTAWILSAAIIGAMIPDLDMFYFHFVSLGRVHHHMFVSHWPLAWLALGLPTIAMTQLRGSARWRNGAIAFFAGVFLHLLLDSIAAPVFWLMPFAPGRLELTVVPASQSHWILSYLLHWTFLVELAIWAVAIGFYKVRRRTKPGHAMV